MVKLVNIANIVVFPLFAYTNISLANTLKSVCYGCMVGTIEKKNRRKNEMENKKRIVLI
jgi:hypothetical protein